jgi:hypothetical protein
VFQSFHDSSAAIIHIAICCASASGYNVFFYIFPPEAFKIHKVYASDGFPHVTLFRNLFINHVRMANLFNIFASLNQSDLVNMCDNTSVPQTKVYTHLV